MKSLTTRFKEEVFDRYVELLKSQYRIADRFASIKRDWESKLTPEELVRGPFLEAAQTYAIGSMPVEMGLNARVEDILSKKLRGNPLYRHQADAISLLLKGENAVVATGTSSGKTLCYQIPIINHLIENPKIGLRAIIIYPLNALVNDQLKEWQRLLTPLPEITFARFTGDTPSDQKEYVRNLRGSDDSVRNRLDHRDAIRKTPPNILITNFSMLEYLLERPVDAPIFENANLDFLVLDEAHAYRGVQATEIAFLIRRVKERLRPKQLRCVATSATLGDMSNQVSREEVRTFATNLFGEPFNAPNPIAGVSAEPEVKTPSLQPDPNRYIEAISSSEFDDREIARRLGWLGESLTLNELLLHDSNLLRLRRDILCEPKLLSTAANELWRAQANASDGLLALLELVSKARKASSLTDLLPTRLHYFIRAQAGLFACLNPRCPERNGTTPRVFVSRKEDPSVPEGLCPACYKLMHVRSSLVEIVGCEKCGHLYGALQDTSRHRYEESGESGSDSFSTDLGWASDSYWTYFSIDPEFAYPFQPEDLEEGDPNLIDHIPWCAACGKRIGATGDHCHCISPIARSIDVFWRQGMSGSPERSRNPLASNFATPKKLLRACPNCGIHSSLHKEPVSRFQESDDEMGVHMAIPFSSFVVGGDQISDGGKVLCFTDNRQRAAAFPSLIEEVTFIHELGRRICESVREQEEIQLLELADRFSEDAYLTLPESRFEDEREGREIKGHLWRAEVLSYFGIPGAGRDSVEDVGLIEVSYNLLPDETSMNRRLFASYGIESHEADDILQQILSMVRRRNIFSLPVGVLRTMPAFGVMGDTSLARNPSKGSVSWIAAPRKIDGIEQVSQFQDYLLRVLGQEPASGAIAKLWDEFLIPQKILVQHQSKIQLDASRFRIRATSNRFKCSRCGTITVRSVRGRCPRKGCSGTLREAPFDSGSANLIEKWISDHFKAFRFLRSEEHTAQVPRDIAREVEQRFRADSGANLIDLLSSTTTFEMGIDIGDLQKILLRNPPPTSASYIQRVGRAGRGSDKNSVCVTLCKRTKYDNDVWENPPHVMRGAVRPTKIFLLNRKVAQRHINAVLFAEFLRESVRSDFRNSQQIDLELFLTGLPKTLTRLNISEPLDFSGWLMANGSRLLEGLTFAQEMVSSVGGVNHAIRHCSNGFLVCLGEINTELEALVKELSRYKETDELKEADDVKRVITNLRGADVVSEFARRGFLPRYAFPLDVVTLETSMNRWDRRNREVELSRDAGIAIAEFAPGAQVVARKQIFTSAGIWIVSKKDRPDSRYFVRCPACQQIRIEPTKTGSMTCKGCGARLRERDVREFIQPRSFSVELPHAKSSYSRGTLVRQRQSLIKFVDNVEDSLFQNLDGFLVGLKFDGLLFRYNAGGGKDEGFFLCPYCGWSSPKSRIKGQPKHKPLRSFGKPGKNCEGSSLSMLHPISFAHEFRSTCLIVRPPQIEGRPESLAYALLRGAIETMELDSADLDVSWRQYHLRSTSPWEIILFETAPGGSGFLSDAISSWPKIRAKAKSICEVHECERACYSCLKSYSNQRYHETLDKADAISSL